MTCKCGFKFAGDRELRNSDAFVTEKGSGVICPDCGKAYVNGVEVTIEVGDNDKNSGKVNGR